MKASNILTIIYLILVVDPIVTRAQNITEIDAGDGSFDHHHGNLRRLSTGIQCIWTEQECHKWDNTFPGVCNQLGQMFEYPKHSTSVRHKYCGCDTRNHPVDEATGGSIKYRVLSGSTIVAHNCDARNGKQNCPHDRKCRWKEQSQIVWRGKCCGGWCVFPATSTAVQRCEKSAFDGY